MKCYYRISDNSYPKIKAPGATKQVCFENFLDSFCPNNDLDMTVVADNCKDKTLDYLYKMQSGNPLQAKFKIEETNLGNAGALLFSIEQAMDTVQNEIVYFVEDDYLHDPCRAMFVLQDGETISREGYWTLYDHPDKYSRFYEYGEVSKVRRTEQSHWRESISTTMTFACHSKTLADDVSIWIKHLGDAFHPNDHEIFQELCGKGRKLNVAIPGVACHADLTYSGAIGLVSLESWAVKILFDRYYKHLRESENEIAHEYLKQLFGDCVPDPSFYNLAKVMAILEGSHLQQ